MNRSGKARLGVIRAGTAGRRHISAIAECRNATRAGIADTNSAVLGRFACEDVICAHSLDELLSSTRLDGVVVATPTDQHLKPVLRSLAAGLCVLVEKPVADSLNASRQIADAASAAERPILVGHQRRFHKRLSKPGIFCVPENWASLSCSQGNGASKNIGAAMNRLGVGAGKPGPS